VVTGAFGQDAFHLFSLYRQMGERAELYGLVRNLSDPRLKLFKSRYPEVIFSEVDISQEDLVQETILKLKPNQIFNLAGISSIQDSWKDPLQTHNVNFVGFRNILNSTLKLQDLTNVQTSIYQASSSEVFGKTAFSPQNEETPFKPINPYGVSKANAHELALEYMKKYGLKISIGILYNHESPLRTTKFVSMKIAHFVNNLRSSNPGILKLGNIDSRRDWGYAGDYVVAMQKMLELEKFETYVIATGVQHSVRDFLDLAFKTRGVDDWTKFVAFSEEFNRKTDHNNLVGDSSKALQDLNWKAKTTFTELVQLMISESQSF
jgi:GDPmannose 4,6-dehydratase